MTIDHDLGAGGLIAHDWPSVSVVLPTYQERHHIRDCLDSLLAQDYPGDWDLIVADGGSTDGTRDILAECSDRVRVVDNERVTAAAAMNTGLAATRAEVVVRADAHTLYAPDYVRRNVEVLLETGAGCVGGPMRPVGVSPFGRAVAAVTQSPFGVGPGRFHYATERTEVETVYLGCWRRETLVELGGWDDENLQWAAEDQELAFRLRRSNREIVLDGTIETYYFPRDTPRALWRQYRNYGLAKASTLAKHRTLPYWRPLVPAAFVAAAAIGLTAPRRALRIAVPAVHACACGVVSTRLASRLGVATHRTFLVIQICHWSYGVGFWIGISRILRGGSFDRRPGASR